MNCPKIKSVKVISEHTLLVEFNNQQKRQYDVKPLFFKEMFSPLKNADLFKSVKVDVGGYAVVWNEDIDISEYELWRNGRPNMTEKEIFAEQLEAFVSEFKDHISTNDGQWTIKGFVDIFQNVYTISSDTKIVSKILEIHLFPKILHFAKANGYKVVLAEHQNYFPDISFVKASDESVRFAVDFKTTYRNPKKPHLCNGFTLGSHGKYFEHRTSTKNIQFPYGSYSGQAVSTTSPISSPDAACFQNWVNTGLMSIG
ncbi:MAG: type II restriction endonuclease [Methylococcaceae bacterium]